MVSAEASTAVTPAAQRLADRRCGLHFDIARGWAQAGGDRDAEAIRYLDAADRIAPTRIRNDPIARDVVLILMIAGRPYGRYVTACGHEVLAASLIAQESGYCRFPTW